MSEGYRPEWVVKSYVGGDVNTKMFATYEMGLAHVHKLNREKRSDMVTLTRIKSGGM